MKLLALLCALLGVVCNPTDGTAVRYDNYKVIRITPRSDEDLVWVSTLADVWKDRVDFWRHAKHVGSSTDVMVPPHWQSEFMDVVKDQGVDQSELISNVQSVIKASEEDILNRRKRSTLEDTAFKYDTYHPLDEIDAWITNTANENPTLASEEQLSTSYEGRLIKAIKLGTPGANKPMAYIQGGIHAREWISPATMMWLSKRLLDNYTKDANVKAMLDTFDWYVVPVLNPDGYHYTWAKDRMWRKNRRRPGDNPCTGIDLNRNYDYEWGGQGSSPFSCSETYHGPSPLSEPEHQGVAAFLLAKQQTNGVHLFMDFHSYGQYWLYPWGYTGIKETPQPDRFDQDVVANAANDAIIATHGKSYFVGESGPDFYPAAGGSEDWGYGSLGAKYTYIVELRDEGEFGFLLPEAQIEPTVDEIYNAMMVVGDRLVTEFGS